MSEPVTLIQNAIYIPEKDFYLKSSHVHDFRTYVFEGHTDPSNGRTLEISVDGGLEYSRRVGALYDANRLNLYEERSLTTEDPFESRIANWLVGNLWQGRRSTLKIQAHR